MTPTKRQLREMPEERLLSLATDVEEALIGMGAERKEVAPPTVRTSAEWRSLADSMGPIPVRSTGWSSMDRMSLGGIAEGECVLVAGGTGLGKTHFATSLALNFARRGERVLYLAIEDGWRLFSEKLRIMEPGLNGLELIDVPDEETVLGDVVGFVTSVADDYSLIVVDNLFTLPTSGGDPDKIWNEQAVWIDRFCDVVRGKRCSAVVLHHITGKAALKPGDEPENWHIMGSTRLTTRVGQTWLLWKDEEDPTVCRAKGTKNRRGLVANARAELKSAGSGRQLMTMDVTYLAKQTYGK